jgi:hypothetical protein
MEEPAIVTLGNRLDGVRRLSRQGQRHYHVAGCGGGYPGLSDGALLAHPASPEKMKKVTADGAPPSAR